MLLLLTLFLEPSSVLVSLTLWSTCEAKVHEETMRQLHANFEDTLLTSGVLVQYMFHLTFSQVRQHNFILPWYTKTSTIFFHTHFSDGESQLVILQSKYYKKQDQFTCQFLLASISCTLAWKCNRGADINLSCINFLMIRQITDYE